MIFVTVGTHEQPFDRLIGCVDRMKRDGLIQEDVVMQTGYSTYEPTSCTWQKLFPYQDMVRYMREARIVVTHGGPSSFIMPLQMGKVPIVMPRQKKYGEHVNDHQVEFCRSVSERYGSIIIAGDEDELFREILDYEKIVIDMPRGVKSNNGQFNERLEGLVDGLFAGEK